MVSRGVTRLSQAIAQHKAGRYAEAEQGYLAWLRTHPGDPDASFYLGGLRQQQGRPAEAAELFKQVIAQEDNRADAWLNLGVALRAVGEPSSAMACFERALALVPTSPVAHYNLGIVLQDLKRPELALPCFERAIALRPDHAGTHCNRGAVLASLKLDAAALESFERALALEPDNAIARHNRGLARLRLGLFDGAWADCDFRWKRPGVGPYRHAAIAPWRGDKPLEGKRILLWSEQGYGDTLQFCRYAPMVAALGGEVVLEAQHPLKSLLASLSGVAQLRAQGETLPHCDYEIPLLSLPLAFDTTLDTVPAGVPYLHADAGKVRSLDRLFAPADRRPRIGLACSGSRTHINDANRSVPLSRFAALFDRAQVFLLQKELSGEDEATLRQYPVRDLRPELADFSDSAAVIAHLDLVVSVDTAVAHLAGALGKPVWLLLPFAPDWRWMLERDDSPWYPNTRLFRQRRPGAWNEPIEQVLDELHGHAWPHGDPS